MREAGVPTPPARACALSAIAAVGGSDGNATIEQGWRPPAVSLRWCASPLSVALAPTVANGSALSPSDVLAVAAGQALAPGSVCWLGCAAGVMAGPPALQCDADGTWAPAVPLAAPVAAADGAVSSADTLVSTVAAPGSGSLMQMAVVCDAWRRLLDAAVLPLPVAGVGEPSLLGIGLFSLGGLLHNATTGTVVGPALPASGATAAAGNLTSWSLAQRLGVGVPTCLSGVPAAGPRAMNATVCDGVARVVWTPAPLPRWVKALPSASISPWSNVSAAVQQAAGIEAMIAAPARRYRMLFGVGYPPTAVEGVLRGRSAVAALQRSDSVAGITSRVVLPLSGGDGGAVVYVAGDDSAAAAAGAALRGADGVARGDAAAVCPVLATAIASAAETGEC